MGPCDRDGALKSDTKFVLYVAQNHRAMFAGTNALAPDPRADLSLLEEFDRSMVGMATNLSLVLLAPAGRIESQARSGLAVRPCDRAE
jgi:hypothetical protein